jgi:hypothetical protein
MSELSGFRVAVLATDGFEDSELTEPVKALREAGAQVTILSPKTGKIQGVRHDIDKTIKVKVDRAIKDARADEFDAVHLPGGALNADAMRMVPEVQAFLKAMQATASPSPSSVTRLGSWSRQAWCVGARSPVTTRSRTTSATPVATGWTRKSLKTAAG